MDAPNRIANLVRATARATLLACGIVGWGASLARAATNVPFTFENRSTYPDDQVWVAIVGEVGGHVWLDPATGGVHPMSLADNTVPGPVIGGNKGPGGKGLYANCFVRLSDIPSRTVSIPAIAGARIFTAFGSPLYLYFFGYSGAPSGYAGVNLANPTDPNQGIRFEMVELTIDGGGIWANTTRVDSYQHPMGLEVVGAGGFRKKTGEIVSHADLLARWTSDVPSAFQGCLNPKTGAISAPSKIPAFQTGGAQADYFKSYVDAIWAKYAGEDLVFSSGDAGVWKGRVEGERFVFHNLTNSFGNATAIISRRPTTQEVLEGKGVLAEDVQKIPGQTLDLVVQAQFCAALNRHAIDLGTPTGATQVWSDSSKFFKSSPSNEYVKFWHRADVSWNRLSYGFCYDDVFDFSSTIHTPSPLSATVVLGGYVGNPTGLARKPIAREARLVLSADRRTLLSPSFVAGRLAVTDLRGATIASGDLDAGRMDLGRSLRAGTYAWILVKGSQLRTGLLVVDR